jgi:hypothetical protein
LSDKIAQSGVHGQLLTIGQNSSEMSHIRMRGAAGHIIGIFQCPNQDSRIKYVGRTGCQLLNQDESLIHRCHARSILKLLKMRLQLCTTRVYKGRETKISQHARTKQSTTTETYRQLKMQARQAPIKVKGES